MIDYLLGDGAIITLALATLGALRVLRDLKRIALWTRDVLVVAARNVARQSKAVRS